MSNKTKFNASAPIFIPQVDSNFASRMNAPPQPTKPAPKPKTNRNRETRGGPQLRVDDEFSLRLEEQITGGNFKPRGRKGQISINHLLDFSLPRHEQEHNSSNNSHRRKHRVDDKIHLQGMSFINVNYKFVVDYRGDYRTQILDTNVPVDKSSILRIVIPKGNSCPICLSDEPIAPRMLTACGHIVCLSCLLSFLDSEQVTKRDEPVKRYRECPLCSTKIRPDEILPVIINTVDEKLERPKVGDEVALMLMTRPYDSILPLPLHMVKCHSVLQNFPWYFNKELESYSRIIKGDLNYVNQVYTKEKQDILSNFETDKLLYNEDGKYVEKAISDINENMKAHSDKFDNNLQLPPRVATELNQFGLLENEDFSGRYNSGNTYFYYQTGFSSSVTFILSSLDVKILKTAFEDYTRFPSSIVLKIENIKYDEVSTDNLKRYKYLSNLPMGTEIGFLECDWKNADVIPQEIYDSFKLDLDKRTKKNKLKFRKEERDRVNALNHEELKARQFYERENNAWGAYDFEANLAKLSMRESGTELPSLLSTSHDSSDSIDARETMTTVWGTTIPKSEDPYDQDDFSQDDWDAEEMIRKAKEEINNTTDKRKKGKKKKTLVVLSSGARRG